MNNSKISWHNIFGEFIKEILEAYNIEFHISFESVLRQRKFIPDIFIRVEKIIQRFSNNSWLYWTLREGEITVIEFKSPKITMDLESIPSNCLIQNSAYKRNKK